MIEKSFIPNTSIWIFYSCHKEFSFLCFFVGSMFIFLSFERSSFYSSFASICWKIFPKIHWLFFMVAHVSPTGDILLIFHKHGCGHWWSIYPDGRKAPKTGIKRLCIVKKKFETEFSSDAVFGVSVFDVYLEVALSFLHSQCSLSGVKWNIPNIQLSIHLRLAG